MKKKQKTKNIQLWEDFSQRLRNLELHSVQWTELMHKKTFSVPRKNKGIFSAIFQLHARMLLKMLNPLHMMQNFYRQSVIFFNLDFIY